MTAAPPKEDAGPARDQPEPGHGRSGQRVFKAADLFAGTREIIIEHQEADYRLRLTSKGKLILTR